MDTNLPYSDLALRIKERAAQLGFAACGIARAKAVDETTRAYLSDWLKAGCHGEMHYLANHFEKRCDPRLLVEGCQSLVVVALNYFPKEQIPKEHPQISIYAYGDDYHEVMRQKLQQLYEVIAEVHSTDSFRLFCDTAPLLERYWAVQAGIGFVGKNRQLILPHKGSYFFLGVIATSIPLPADTPLVEQCGACNRCMECCPTGAISSTKGVDASRCISYHTIENRGEIPPHIASHLENRLFGCDTCQEVCPHNRWATPTTEPRFALRPELLTLDRASLSQMQQSDFSRIFKGSPLKRAKYEGLMRNLHLLQPAK